MAYRGYTICALFAAAVLFGGCADRTVEQPWLNGDDSGNGPPPEEPECRQPGSDPDLRDRARALFKAEPVLRIETNHDRMTVSPHGCYAAFENVDNELRIADLTGSAEKWTVRNPSAGKSVELTSMSFTRRDENTAWFAASDGSIRLLSLGDFSQIRSVHGIEEGGETEFWYVDVGPNGRYLALEGWDDATDEAVATIFDTLSDKRIDTWRVWSTAGPAIAFLPASDTAVIQVAGSGSSGVRPMRLYDPEAEATRASWSRWVANDTAPWAATDGWIAYSHVGDNRDYQIRRLDRETMENSVVDASPRSGHFIDLFAAPSGRWLAEWDFEENGIRRYDMTGEREPLTFGHEFQGFAQSTDLIFSSNEDRRSMLMYDPADGEKLGAVEAFGGRSVQRVRGISADRLAVRWYDGGGATMETSFVSASRPATQGN